MSSYKLSLPALRASPMQLTPRIDPVRPVNTSFKMRKRESAWLLLQTGVEGMFANQDE